MRKLKKILKRPIDMLFRNQQETFYDLFLVSLLIC